MDRIVPRPSPELRCAYCHGPALVEDAEACAGCGTLVHPGCRVEVGTCPTLGCARSLRLGPTAKRSWIRQVASDVAVALVVYLVVVCVAALTRPRVDWGARPHADRGRS